MMPLSVRAKLVASSLGFLLVGSLGNVLQIDILVFGPQDSRLVATSDPRHRLPFSRPDAREVRAGRVVSHFVTAGGERHWQVMAPHPVSRAESHPGVGIALCAAPDDEFGVLAAHFDGLVDRETQFRAELQARVEEATAELASRYREVERLNAVLFQMQRTLSQVDRLTLAGRIMAEVAHEVGTPLHSVAGHLEFLRRDLPPALLSDDLARRLSVIERKLSRVTEIIAQLLDLTRRAPAEASEVDVNRVVRDTLDLVRPGFTAAGLDLELALAPDLPPVAGHATPLQQVVLNLVTNAMDATPSGGRLTVRTRAAGEGIEIEVSDTGEGIPPARRKQIFEPFFTTKAPGRGTGLGLFISAQIIRDHRGRMDVESEPGRGSTFRVVLPTALRAITAVAARPAHPPHSARTDHPGRPGEPVHSAQSARPANPG